MKLIEEVGFDQSFSFVYSRRPGTPAAALPDATPQAVKLARLQRLQAKINEQAGAISRAMLGTRQRVLVEGRAKRNAAELSGRTGNNRVVNFPGPGAPDRPVRRRDRHRRPAPFAARGNRRLKSAATHP